MGISADFSPATITFLFELRKTIPKSKASEHVVFVIKIRVTAPRVLVGSLISIFGTPSKLGIRALVCGSSAIFKSSFTK